MSEIKQESTVALIKQEINRQIGDADTLKSLIATTFTNKGVAMAPELVKRALLEGMLRGFKFEQFLNKDVYAVPFGDGYSLVTSIDYSRKVGARSGIVGVRKPEYGMDGAKIVSCSVTVLKRFPDGYVGEFEAEVDFGEYAGQNLWKTKPKTMISKVAEMHALRKACPEELAQVYVEEELQKAEAPKQVVAIDLDFYRTALKGCTTQEAFERIHADMPAEARAALKDEIAGVKAMITSEAEVTVE